MSLIQNASIPTGSIYAYLGTTDPSGWVIMDGVARTNNSDGKYNALNALGIGTGGSGTSSYTPPNYKGAFLRGNGTHSISTSHTSSALGQSQEDAIGSHTHSVNDPGHSHTTKYAYEIWDSTQQASTATGLDGDSDWNNLLNYSNTGITLNSSGSVETRPNNYSVNWILKL